MSTPWAVAVVLLACATGALAVITLSLVRQFGILAIRLNPSAGMETAEGPGPGTELPEQDVPLLKGGTVQLGGARDVSQLVVFFSPDCSICNVVSSYVETIARQYRDRIDLLIVIHATPRVAREYLRDHRFERMAVTLKQNFPSTLGISTTPFALAISREGTVAGRGVPNALEHLEVLIERADTFDSDAEGVYATHQSAAPSAPPVGLAVIEPSAATAAEGGTA